MPKPTISSAGHFYDRVIAGGTSFIENLAAEGMAESEWVDFKVGEHLDDDQIKVTWSKALAGFANNQGGVLIWGIDARYDKTSKVDVASDVKPVPHPSQLRARLVQLYPTGTEPPLPGVLIQEFFQSGTNGPGFVVCFIPESDIKPLRAECMPGKPYMMRIGDSFQNPSPSLLRNLFYPRSSAKLSIVMEPRWNGMPKTPGNPDPSQIEVRFDVSVRNAGVVSAKELVIIAENIRLSQVGEVYGVEKWQTETGVGISYPRTVHPSASALVFIIREWFPVARETRDGQSFIVPLCRSGYTASFRLLAFDTQPTKMDVMLDDLDITMKRLKEGVPTV